MSEDSSKGVEFDDMENASFSKEDVTIRGIVLNHVKKICMLSCDEFRGGYENNITEIKDGLKYVRKVYVPDARARYNQAIDTLYDLLTPFFDDLFKEVDKIIQEMDTKIPDKKLEKSRKLFKELNNLLYRKDYLSE